MITDNILREAELDELYDWVDSLPLSRPKKNINRDFADAVMMAEVVHLHLPKIVELHNYPPGNSLKAKLANWRTLHTKVLSRLGITLSEEDFKRVSTSKPLSIEPVLYELKMILEERKKEVQNTTFRNMGDDRAARGSQGEVQMGAKLSMAGKVEQLKEVYSLLKEKIDMVQRSIERKDVHIRELQGILKQYTNRTQ